MTLKTKITAGFYFLSLCFYLPALGAEKVPAKNVIWSAEAALGHFEYAESLENVKADSNVLLVKLMAQRHFGEEEQYDLTGTARLSVISLGGSVSSDLPTSLSEPSYYDADLILCYHPHAEELGIKRGVLKVGLGIQTWGMTISGNEYGIKTVQGPEFMAQIENPDQNSTPWTTHLKIAPLSEKTVTFSLNSYKVVIGGSYRLTSDQDRALDLTYNIEKISLTLETSVNQIEVFMAGAGLRYSF